jgi:predicted Rossmann fold flavoprotein
MPAGDTVEHVWDVAVIGGGPAGMMAAAQAAHAGASVILIEKNKELGKKLLITGGGRCNVTNGELDNKKFLAKFKDSGKFLFSPFSQWSVRESLEFFHARGMPTKEEAEQRVFPLSNRSQSVWDTLVGYLKENDVTVHSHAQVLKLHANGSDITSAEVRGGKTIRARSFILATGGTSHPETGSSGDGYKWLRELGHSVNDASAALVPVALKEPASGAAGVSVQNAKVTLYQNEAKQAQQKGKILFTHVGLSGPCILNMSRDINELLKYGVVVIEIDLLPDMGYEKVNAALQNAFKENSNKKIKNALKGILAPALIPFVLKTASIDPETFCNSVTRDARVRLMRTLKHFRFEVKGLLGMEKAIITAGGLALTEIDFKNMRSLKYHNLYVVGDILDISRPSGGYSLQLCWTTGFVAGSAAAASAHTA